MRPTTEFPTQDDAGPYINPIETKPQLKTKEDILAWIFANDPFKIL